MFLVVEDQDTTSSRLNPLLVFISIGHGLKAHSMSHESVRSWTHAPKTEMEEKYANNFCHSFQKQR